MYRILCLEIFDVQLIGKFFFYLNFFRMEGIGEGETFCVCVCSVQFTIYNLAQDSI